MFLLTKKKRKERMNEFKKFNIHTPFPLLRRWCQLSCTSETTSLTTAAN